jgi:hypothetical protein
METMDQKEWVIFEYPLDQAIDDGVLHRLGWVDGKPLIGTAGIVEDVPHEERQRLFAEFFRWQKEIEPTLNDIEPTLNDEDRMFEALASNGENVWVIDDGAAITLLYPSDS